MAIIAPQCQVGGYNHNGHSLVCDWPYDCYVQWGGSGLVLSSKGNYLTAFFEVFTKVPKSFIRGEAETIKEAEKVAFEKLQKILNCPNHEFERGGYDNGAAICKHCRMFKGDAFEPLTRCYWCGKPTTFYVDTHRRYWCEEHALRANETYGEIGLRTLRFFLIGFLDYKRSFGNVLRDKLLWR